MSQAELLASLPEKHRRHLDPASSSQVRMMAARGMVPLPPRDLIVVLVGLALDDNAELAASASASLDRLPDNIIGPVLEGALPTVALGVLVGHLAGREELVEKLVLNRGTPDDAIASIAADVTEGIAEIIANDQERCLRSQPLVEEIRKNPNVARAVLDRLFDFLVRSGVIHEDMAEFGQAVSRLGPQDMEQVVDEIELPDMVGDFTAEVPGPSPAAVETEERIPATKLLAQLTGAQKVAMAFRGNKEIRNILIRDTNRVVAASVIKNPRITDQEILAAAQSRSVSDEVIRIISSTKDFIRSYAVKVALVNNPKTPLPTAMRFLTVLRAKDLQSVAKSKGIPAALANQAKRMLAKKGSNR